MKIFLRKLDGFCTKIFYYSDTDSLYIEKKYWNIGMCWIEQSLLGDSYFNEKLTQEMMVWSMNCF